MQHPGGLPAASIDDAIARMDRIIARCAETGDARGWFAVVYRAVTARVRDGIAAGAFDDGERMEAFDVRFAGLWLDAFDAWDRDAPVSQSWACSFAAAERPGLILQHLLLGMNAHINLDLGLAAAQTCPGPGVVELRDDFERINDVLAELVDAMQDAIGEVSPMARVLDLVGLRLDEAMVSFSLSQARARSWRFAEELAGADLAPTLVGERDLAVAGYGARLARPGFAMRCVLPIARWREEPDLARVAGLLRARGADVAL